MTDPRVLFPSRADPAVVYYCKAGIAKGTTVRIAFQGQRYACRGVSMNQCDGGMVHDNSTGKAKASGARCVLQLTSGRLDLFEPIERLTK